MSNYTVDLSPIFTNIAEEGGLDTSLLNGRSLQRTLSMIEVINNSCAPKPCRKMISVHDGDTYNDTTFQNKDAVGTFEAGLTFTASQILTSDNGNDETGFYGVGAILAITPEQSEALNSYGYTSLYFSAVWGNGSYDEHAYLNIFPDGDNFTDIAVIVPVNEAAEAYCGVDPSPRWNLPVTTINFIAGFNNGPGFLQGQYNNIQMIHRLFKQVAAQQEVDFTNKTPQEKADLIRSMLENLDDDHPLVANLRKR
jgi:hypothetical protein